MNNTNTEMGEPVVWRVQYHLDRWQLCYSRNAADRLSRELGGAAIEPLYAHPQPPAQREAVIEEVAAMLKREYPDNVNTNAFCAAIRFLAVQPIEKSK